MYMQGCTAHLHLAKGEREACGSDLAFHSLACNVGLTQLVSLAMRISSDEHTFHDDDLDSRTPPARQISSRLPLLPPRRLTCRQVQPALFEGRCLGCFVQLCTGNSGCMPRLPKYRREPFPWRERRGQWRQWWRGCRGRAC